MERNTSKGRSDSEACESVLALAVPVAGYLTPKLAKSGLKTSDEP